MNSMAMSISELKLQSVFTLEPKFSTFALPIERVIISNHEFNVTMMRLSKLNTFSHNEWFNNLPYFWYMKSLSFNACSMSFRILEHAL